MRALTRWLRPDATPPLPRPSQPICLIGDIHGRIDLLEKMLEQIAAQPGSDAARIVVLGDMIDRGPDSATVLRRLHALQTTRPDHVICLMGNHERMMLDFITSPDLGTGWLRSGGDATTSSYGLPPADAPERLAEGLSERIGQDILHWLTQLPLTWLAEGLMAVHAAADPAAAPEQQTQDALLWGHRDFGRRPRQDGLWVACGHVIVPTPIAEAGRIAVDTGAWHTGVLSAAWLDAQALQFLQVRSDAPTGT